MDCEFEVGTRVVHKGEPGFGTIKAIDFDCYPLNVYGVTTVEVEWDDCPGKPYDIQWTNKLWIVEDK